MLLDTYEKWFILADQDNDGKISGTEAVQFFSKSGLPTLVLGRIWDLVCKGQDYLLRPQFNLAIGLISLAQSNNNVLDEEVTRKYLTGTTDPAKPPRLTGLYEPPPTQTFTQQPLQQQSLQSAQQGLSGSSWPPVSPHDYNKYRSVFAALDTQKTGKVKGVDCFTIFMRWGLPRETLKSMWALVAGDAGELDSQQFVQCLYLMEQVKRGVPLPPALPPGQFPPVQTEVGQLPAKVEFQPTVNNGNQGQGQGQGYSLVPNLPVQMSQFTHTERQRLQNEHMQAQNKFEEFQSTQQKLLTEKEKGALYSKSLQELMIFKSKMDSSLLQVNDQLQRETANAEQAKKRYDDVRSTVEVKSRSLEELKVAIESAQKLRAEYEQKLVELDQDLTKLEQESPGQLQGMQSEVMDLQNQIQQKENRKQEVQVQIENQKQQKQVLQKQVEDLEFSVAALEADLHTIEHEVGSLTKKFDVNESQDARDVVTMLQRCVAVHKKLVEAASKSKIPVPAEAATLPGGFAMTLQSTEDDWGDFEDEGFQVFDAGEASQGGNPFAAVPAASKPSQPTLEDPSSQTQDDPFESNNKADPFSFSTESDPFSSAPNPPQAKADPQVYEQATIEADVKTVETKAVQDDPFQSNVDPFSQEFSTFSLSSNQGYPIGTSNKKILGYESTFDPFGAPASDKVVDHHPEEAAFQQQQIHSTSIPSPDPLENVPATQKEVGQPTQSIRSTSSFPDSFAPRNAISPSVSENFDPFTQHADNPSQQQDTHQQEETFSPFGDTLQGNQETFSPFGDQYLGGQQQNTQSQQQTFNPFGDKDKKSQVQQTQSSEETFSPFGDSFTNKNKDKHDPFGGGEFDPFK